jgi:uncharacterized membrane protein
MKKGAKRGNFDIVSLLFMGLVTLTTFFSPVSNLITGDAVLTIDDIAYSIETTGDTDLILNEDNSLHIYLINDTTELKIPYFDYFQVSGGGNSKLLTYAIPTFVTSIEETSWIASTAGQNLFHPDLGLSQYVEWVLTASSDWTLNNVTILSTINSPPVLSESKVTPTTGGWGETFTFSTEVTDVDEEPVYLTLFVKDGSGNWIDKGTGNCDPCTGSNNPVNWPINNLDSSYIGASQFKIQKDDDYTIYNSTPIDFTIEPDNVSFTLAEGDGEVVNRTTGDVTLKLRLNDTDEGEYPSGVAGQFYVQTGSGGASSWSDPAYTDVDGYFTAFLGPAELGDTFSVLGDKNWYLEVTDADYENLQSQTYSFELLGGINGTINEPANGLEVPVLTDIDFEVEYRDDLGNLMIGTALDPVFKFKLSGASVWTDGCDLTDGDSDGVYDCSLDTSGLEDGDYDVSFNASKTNYNANETISLSHFTLTGASTGAVVSITTPNDTITDMKALIPQTLPFTTTFTNGGLNKAQFVNLTITAPSGWTTTGGNSGGNKYVRATEVSASGFFSHEFSVEVQAGEEGEDNYPVTVTAEWLEPNGYLATYQDTSYIDISKNKETVFENDLDVDVYHNTNNILGNFTITAVGNEEPGTLTFDVTDGDFPAGWTVTTDKNDLYLNPGESGKVEVRINIPNGQAPGDYWANFTASNGAAYRADGRIDVSVQSSQTWVVDDPEDMQTITPGDSGRYKAFTVRNTGNVGLTFSTGSLVGSISDMLGDTGYVQDYSGESLPAGQLTTVEVWYDIDSEVIPATYYVNFTLDSSGSTPSELPISCGFALTDQNPVINSFSDTPDPVDLNSENITITADVEDFVYVDNVWARVTLPNTNVVNYDLTPLSVDEKNVGTWQLKFVPDQQGTYYYIISVNDSSDLRNDTSETVASFVTAQSTDLDFTLNFSTYTEIVTDSLKACDASIDGEIVGGCVKIEVDIENLGPSGSYSTLFAFDLPGSWNATTGEENFIGKINDGVNEINSYSIAIPAGTIADIYDLNATVGWRNPDGTIGFHTQAFQINVSNITSTLTAEIHQPNPSGQTLKVGNDIDFLFEISDLEGNAVSNLDTISFTISRGGFSEDNRCTLIASSNNYSCTASTTGLAAGDYDIQITGNKSFYNDLNYSSINPFTLDDNAMSANFVVDPTLLIIDNMTSEDDYIFEAVYSFTNLGEAPATNVTLEFLSFDSNWNVSDWGTHMWSTVDPQLTKEKSFIIKIPAGTLFGDFFNVSASYITPQGQTLIKKAEMNVTLDRSPNLEITNNLVANVNHNTGNDAGGFTIKSIGTDHSVNTAYVLSQFSDPTMEGWLLPDYDTSKIFDGFLPYGTNTTINFTAVVPGGQTKGLYSALFEIYSEINNVLTLMDTKWLNLTVLQSFEWDLSHDNFSTTVEQGIHSGDLFELTIYNNGNEDYIFNLGVSQEPSSPLLQSNMVFVTPSTTIGKMQNETILLQYATAGNQEAGTYLYNLLVRHSSSDVTITIPINITVADLPPQISNVLIDNENVDINFENATITAEVTDSILVDSVWMNITQNGAIYEEAYDSALTYQDGEGSQSGTWEGKFLPTVEGTYGITIFANDSGGMSNFTTISYTFDVIARTDFGIAFAPTSPTISTITQTQDGEVIIEMNASNTGDGGGYFVNVSIDDDNGFDVAPPYIPYESILDGDSVSNSFTITVPEGTTPGLYTLNPRVRWIQPQGGPSSEGGAITINVSSNPDLFLVEPALSLNVLHGSSNSTTSTVSSRGNDLLTDITFSCEESRDDIDICTNFDISFDPDGFDLASSLTMPVEITAESEPGLAPNTYYGTIQATSDEGLEDSRTLTIVVPEGKEWAATDNLSFNVGIENSGIVNDFIISNNGNIPLNFTIDVSGNVSDILTFNTTPIQILPQEYVGIPYGYNSTGFEPDSYEGVINVSCLQCNTYAERTVDIEILNYTLALNSPTTALTNKSYGNTISMNVFARNDDGIINHSIDWEVLLDDYSCLNTTAVYNGNWTITCYLPNIPSGVYYDLNIRGTDLNTSAIAISTFENGVHYTDVEAPVINSIEIDDIELNDPVLITVNVTDNVDVTNVSAIIDLPYGKSIPVNGSPSITGFTEILVDQQDGTWEFTFLNTSLTGDYEVTITALDARGLSSENESEFEVYKEISVNLTIQDENSNVMSTDILLYKELEAEFYQFDFPEYYPEEGIPPQIETDIDEATPIRELTVHERLYDVEFDVYEHSVTLLETNFTNTSMLNVTVERLITNNVDLGNDVFLDGFGIHVDSIAFDAAAIKFNYSTFINGTNIKVDQLYVARCTDWNFGLNTCGSGWVLLDYNSPETEDTFWTHTEHFSAFALMELIDDVESSSSSSSSGGGGGGGGGGGYAAVAQNENVEISTNKIEKSLYPTETSVDSFTLTNQGEDSIALTVSVEDVDDFVTISNSVITLTAGETESVVIDFEIPMFTYPGVYTGTISVVGKNVKYSIPVEITVKEVEMPVVQLTLDIVSPEVPRNGTLSYELEVENIGGYVPGLEIDIYTFILNITDGQLGSDEERITFDETSTISRNFQIPEDMPLGDFKLKVLGVYFDKEVTTFATFRVTEDPRLEGPMKDWIPPSLIDFVFKYRFYILLSLFGAYILIFGFKKVTQMSAHRYEFPVPAIKKVPGPATTAMNIGQITELNKPSFVKLKDLTMHGICVGATGGGKTVSAQVIVEEALKHGVNVIVLDPTGQWSGFLQRCNDPEMLANYSKFNMRTSESRGFNGNIRAIENPSEGIDIKPFLAKNKKGVEGEIQIFSLHKLKNKDLEMFINSMIKQVFDAHLEESNTLETLMVFDEVHRLLESFGGSMKGQDQLERGVREFRKWGVGLLMISQVISDFKPQIRANIGTKIQFRSRDKNDLNMIKETFGIEYVRHVVKAMIGRGMIHNPGYNKGMPYFVDVKPLLHHPHKLTNAELERYEHYNKLVDGIKRKMKIMQTQGKDVFDITSILKLLEKNIKKGKFDMVDIYLEEINEKLNR